MCGIVGYVSAYSNGFAYAEAKAFRDMLVVDSLRGFDSTGVFSVSNRGNVELHKEASTGATFVTRTAYDSFSTNAVQNGIFMVGHNRAATRGTVNDVNAHPFCVNDNIVLVQNGTYRGSHKHHKDTEVDTEAIAHVINEHPHDIQLALQKINAAYCLVWYNVKDEALYLIRNDERPMFFGYPKQGGLMFASEGSTITLAAERNDIELSTPPYLISDNMLCKWQLDSNKKTWSFTSIKIDNAYKHVHTPTTSMEDYDTIWGSVRQHPTRYQQTLVVHDTKPSPRSLTTTIHTYAFDDKFKEYMITAEESKDLITDFNLRPRDKELVVSLVDYLPANDSANCLAWYVYGSVLSSTDDAASPVIYTIVNGKTELEIMEMLTDEFYYVHIPGTPIENVMDAKTYGRASHLLTLFVTNARVCSPQHETDAANDLKH